MSAPKPRGASWWALFRQWLRNPLQIAAIAPSSRELAAAMVAALPPGTNRVIELGGGTGALTRALLAKGIRGNGLLVNTSYDEKASALSLNISELGKGETPMSFFSNIDIILKSVDR